MLYVLAFCPAIDTKLVVGLAGWLPVVLGRVVSPPDVECKFNAHFSSGVESR
jgi:hypothetical protein